MEVPVLDKESGGQVVIPVGPDDTVMTLLRNAAEAFEIGAWRGCVLQLPNGAEVGDPSTPLQLCAIEAGTVMVLSRSFDPSLKLLCTFENTTDDATPHKNHLHHHGNSFCSSPNSIRFGDAYLEGTPTLQFATSNAATISCWFRLTNSSTAFNGLVSIGGLHYRLMVSPDRHPFYDAGQHHDRKVDSFKFSLHTWYHYVLTIGKQIAKVYVNGVCLSESAVGVPDLLPNANHILIGRGENRRLYPFKGFLGELRVYTSALSAEEIQLMYKANAAYYTAGSKAKYSFEGLKDDSGLHNDLTNQDGAVSVVAGKASFGPLSGYLQSNCRGFDFVETNQMSISCWFRLTNSSTAFNGLVSIGGLHYRLMVSPDRHPFYDAGQHCDQEVTTHTFCLNTWYHYVLTVEGGVGARVYVDGELVSDMASGVPASLPNAGCLLLGRGETASMCPFQGTLGEVQVHSNALSPEEVRCQYNAKLPEYR